MGINSNSCSREFLLSVLMFDEACVGVGVSRGLGVVMSVLLVGLVGHWCFAVIAVGGPEKHPAAACADLAILKLGGAVFVTFSAATFIFRVSLPACAGPFLP